MKISMKMALGGLAAVSLALGLVACGPLKPKVRTIGIAMPTKSSARWIADGANMVKEFEALGYKVVVAADGDEAVRIARGERFQLVVSDFRMPGMDGVETLLALRAVQPELDWLYETRCDRCGGPARTRQSCS